MEFGTGGGVDIGDIVIVVFIAAGAVMMLKVPLGQRDGTRFSLNGAETPSTTRDFRPLV